MNVRKMLALGMLGGGGAAPTYTISGTVYDADGTTAVASATVALGTATATSGADGTYSITGLAAGVSGSMTCTKTGYYWTAKTINAMAGDLTAQNYTNAEYAAVLAQVYSASEVWPLVNIASGTTITATKLSARNGTLAGWDLRNTAGPFVGTLAPYADGANDYANIYSSNGSTGHADLFSGVTGWASICLKVDTGVWTDGASRFALFLSADGNNFVKLRKSNAANNTFEWAYRAGGTLLSVPIGSLGAMTGWFQAVITWDKNAGASGEVKAYLNGTQQSTTQTSLGTWAGALAAAFAAVGGGNGLTNSTVWKGWLAYVAVGYGAVLTPTQVAAMYDDLINP